MSNDPQETLKELLEAGVISQDEYNAKLKQISLQDAHEERSVSGTEQSIDYEELRTLEELKKGGVITQDEFSAKAALMLGIKDPSNTPKKAHGLLYWLKHNIAVVAIIAVLAAGLAFTAPKCASLQGEINKLNNTINEKTTKLDELSNERLTLLKYRTAVQNFYLDNAVIVPAKGKHYHRYACPEIRDGSFWVKNSEAAESEGYSKCPTCFGVE